MHTNYSFKILTDYNNIAVYQTQNNTIQQQYNSLYSAVKK